MLTPSELELELANKLTRAAHNLKLNTLRATTNELKNSFAHNRGPAY
jgi:hypothetical protein